MRKLLGASLISMTMLFITVSVGSAVTYTVTRLTDNTYDESGLGISGSYAVWSQISVNNGPTEVYLYDGSTVFNISNDPSNRDQHVDVNAKGQAVWMKIGPLTGSWEDEIFLYDGTGAAINISNNTAYRDSFPSISENGYVVWQREWPPEATSAEIYLYDGSTVSNISNDPFNKDKDPRISSDGQAVCWSKYVDTDREIYLYDGTGPPINISNDPSCIDDLAVINAKGWVIWVKRLPYPSRDKEIYLYDGTGPAANISNDPSNSDWVGNINSHGHVVWFKNTGSDREIYLYDGTGPATNISNDPSCDDHSPDINDKGQVVWAKGDGQDMDVYLYEGSGPANNISNNPTYSAGYPRISDNGDVVWRGSGSDYEVFYASPVSGGGGGEDPVGGIAEPIDKIQLLVPWMALATLILLTVGIVVVRRVMK
jgi:hypothetical protein